MNGKLSLKFSPVPDEIREGLEIVSERLGICRDDGGALVSVSKCAEGHSVSGSGGKYAISYSAKPGFFRALAILTDKIKCGVSSFDVSEKAAFKTNGPMIDVSRNAVLNTKTVKDLVERIALMGINMLMLYTEDTYQMEKYPWFGYFRGAYSKEEIREIDEHCNVFGVELIPCIQTFSHLGTALRWPYTRNFRNTGMTLLAEEDATYVFIEDMVKFCSENFTSKRIHIGLDESVDMALGNYLRKNGYKENSEVLLAHLSRVVDITNKYDFKPMMWSDMLFRFNHETSDYDVEAQIPHNISERLPENIQMVYWDYVMEDPEITGIVIDKHAVTNRELIFAGGIWTWNRLSANLDKTYLTAKNQLMACREKGVETVMATIWGNTLNTYNIYTTLPGLQMWAELNYYEDFSQEHISGMFRACNGYSYEEFQYLSFDDFTEEEKEMYYDYSICCINSSYAIFLQDVLLGIMDKTFAEFDFKTHYGKIVKGLSAAKPPKNQEDMFEQYRTAADILYIKCDLGIRLKEAYDSGDREKLKELSEEISVLEEKFEKYIALAGKTWNANCKPFGWEAQNIVLGGAASRIRWAKKRVDDYLAGDISEIEELAAERFYYNEKDRPLTEVDGYRQFMSVGNW